MAAPALRIPVSVDLGQFNASMGQMGRRVDEESDHIESRFNDINKAAGAMALALTAAGGSIVVSLLSTVTSLAKIGDLSDDLRLPVNLLQSLSVAAEDARVPATLLTSALEQFTKASKLGGEEAKTFEKALGNVGASFLKAFQNADSQEERLKIISNALKSTTDEVKRAQLSLQAFGTDNERLITLLGSGASSFDTYRENASHLGLAINESLVKSAQEAKSQIQTLSRVLSDEFTTAVGGLIPVLVRLLPYLEAIALAGKAVGAIFASDDTASIQQLKNELDGLVDRWTRLKQAQNDLQSGDKSKADSLKEQLQKFIGINVNVDEEIKTLDADIAKVRERIETVKKLLASKDAASPTPKPAFEAREPLKTSSSRDRFESAVDSIEKRTAATVAETASIDLGTAAREKAKIAAQLLTVAQQINKEAGINGGQATKEQIETIDRFSAAYGRAAAALEQAHSPLATFGRESANVGRQLNQFAATSLDGMTNALADVITGTKTVAQAFRQMAASIINDLAKIAIRQAITGPIAGALSGLFPVGGAGAVVPSPSDVSGNAGGTDNWRGGMSWVGEKGPELLNLPRGSQVIPNDVLRGMGSGGGGDINVRLSMDLTGVNGEESMARIARSAAQKAFSAAVSTANAAVPNRQQQYRLLGT